ncbi:FixH family protein [Aureispira anguillae]|uniref:FixH family protein n=1 Tax=Aureispira anguillae TaxID=2864201 RepID=A0A915Y9A9_9BACT|nr:FixH family protein [Aureispira anguillae]BDS09308.1 FixH family protein [Aureispira anguillae]
MNWGYRIALFFVAFITFMLFMLYKCVQQNFDLVAPDYYAKEVAFQEQINQQKNVLALAQKPTWEIGSSHLSIQFPTIPKQGKINFFRPSDKQLDFEEQLQLDDQQQQQIPLEKFQKGIYKLQLSWSDNNKDYYIEKQILIP